MLSWLLLPYRRCPPNPYVVLDAIRRHDRERQQYRTLQFTRSTVTAVQVVRFSFVRWPGTAGQCRGAYKSTIPGTVTTRGLVQCAADTASVGAVSLSSKHSLPYFCDVVAQATIPHLEGRSGMCSNAMSSRKPVMESSRPSTTTTADASTGRSCRSHTATHKRCSRHTRLLFAVHRRICEKVRHSCAQHRCKHTANPYLLIDCQACTLLQCGCTACGST
jgi:hypothetical protein